MTAPCGALPGAVSLGRYQALLDRNRNGTISDAEAAELRIDSDRLMIRKAHAAALLRWRGYQIPPADKFQVMA